MLPGARPDHATVAGPDLDALRRSLSAAGLDPAYGGAHDTGATEMAAVGFPDGSYLELIAAVPDGPPAPFWDRPIREAAGPCAWALWVPDIGAAADRLADRGVAVEGPTDFARERPDGTRLEWSMAFPGPGDPGSHLPFLIEDHTPRADRARPGRGSEGTPVAGVERVVVGVPDLSGAVERYGTAFELPAPERRRESRHGVRVARFSGAPVDLAAPAGDDDGDGRWLADRLDRFGPAPCAFLLGTDGAGAGADPDADAGAPDRAGEAGRWLGREVGWIDVTGGPGPGDIGVLY